MAVVQKLVPNEHVNPSEDYPDISVGTECQDIDLDFLGYAAANASLSKTGFKKRGHDEVIDGFRVPEPKRPKRAEVELTAIDQSVKVHAPPATSNKPKKTVLLPEDQYVIRKHGEPLWTPANFLKPESGFVCVEWRGTTRGTRRHLIKARRISSSLWDMLTAADGFVLEYPNGYTSRLGTIFGSSFEDALNDADIDDNGSKSVVPDIVYKEAAGRLLTAFDVRPGEHTAPRLYDEIKRIGHPVPEGARIKFGKNITARIEIDENNVYYDMDHEYGDSSDEETDWEH